ncbi:MAG: hypothetical protein JXR16_14950 [Bermanella sp.]
MLYNAAQLTYLEHLGIDVWVPNHVQLDAASIVQNSQLEPVIEPVVQQATPSQAGNEFTPPSHFEDVPVTGLEPAPEALIEQPTTLNTQQPQPNKPLSSTLNSALTSAIPAPAFPKTSQAQPAEQVTRVEFNIQFWCYSSGVWLVSGDVNTSPEQHKLVHNLAQFIQGKKRRPRHVNVFSWPMIDSPNVDQGEEIAAKYLLGHIDRLQQACERNIVIVFNDCEYFPEQIPHIKLDISLQQLLHEPMAKKALWQQLIPLKLEN